MKITRRAVLSAIAVPCAFERARAQRPIIRIGVLTHV